MTREDATFICRIFVTLSSSFVRRRAYSLLADVDQFVTETYYLEQELLRLETRIVYNAQKILPGVLNERHHDVAAYIVGRLVFCSTNAK